MNSFIKKRSIIGFILLGLITVGIYWIVEFCIFGKEINDLCEGDGEDNMFYLLAWLLGIVTLGIYPLYWFYKAVKRLNDNGYRYKLNIKYSASGFITVALLGGVFGGVGLIAAWCMLLEDLNQYSEVAGYFEPFPYTKDIFERQQRKESALAPVAQFGAANYQNGQPQQNVFEQTVIAQKPTSGEIVGVGGSCNGYRINLADKEEIIIGRDTQSCNLLLADSPSVSRRHVSVKYDATSDKYIVTDMSTAGTFVDNNRLSAHQPAFIERGKVITIANTENSFLLN